MKKYWSIYLTYHRLSLRKLTYYKLSTYTQFLSLFIWVIVDLLFFQSIFSNTGKFAGWDYWDSVLLIFSLSLFWDVFWRITSGGIVYIPDKIINGDINKFLLKPINPLFHLAASDVGLLDNSMNTPILFIYYVVNNGFPFSLAEIVVYLMTVLLGVGIFTWILLIIVSLSFWVTNVEYLSQVYWELQNIARYPKDIFTGFLGNLFMFILPIFFIANIPTDVLRKGINTGNVTAAIILNLVLLTSSLAIWNRGLKAYKGANI